MTEPSLPKVVSQKEWQRAVDQLRIKEKEITRATDAVNAQRRKLPMASIDKDYAFEGEEGKVTLLDLFDGRPQLIVYHFMFGPDADAGCPGCSWVTDAMSYPAHLNARDTSLVLISRAPLPNPDRCHLHRSRDVDADGTGSTSYLDQPISGAKSCRLSGECAGLESVDEEHAQLGPGFDVSELLTSLFMSINMAGAVLAAPLAGALADRIGRRPKLIVAALLVDAVCFLGLTRDVPFAGFMAIRFFEGCAHIFALSLILSLAAGSRGPAHRGRAMGIAGGGLLLGVALGAPIGGMLGADAPERTLYGAAAILVLAAGLAAAVLREIDSPAESRPSLGSIVTTVRAHPRLLAPLTFGGVDLLRTIRDEEVPPW